MIILERLKRRGNGSGYTLGTPAARRYRISAKAHQNDTFSNEKSHISGVAERRKLSWNNVFEAETQAFMRGSASFLLSVTTK